MTGFYSKDVILEVAYAKYTISGNFSIFFWMYCSFINIILFISTFIFYIFSTNATFKSSLKKVHDAPFIMAFPLILVLALGSIFVGYFAKDMMIGFGTDFWSNALFVLPQK